MRTDYITNGFYNPGDLPLITNNIDTDGGPYTITQGGIYGIRIPGGYDGSAIYFPDPTVSRGMRIILANINNDTFSDFRPSLIDTAYPILYGSTSNQVTEIPSGEVYRFLCAEDGAWRTMPSRGVYAKAHFEASNAGYEYNITGEGIYLSRYNNYKPEVSLPNPAEHDGETIIILNPANYGSYPINVVGDYPIYDASGPIFEFAITTASGTKIKSVGGIWRFVLNV